MQDCGQVAAWTVPSFLSRRQPLQPVSVRQWEVDRHSSVTKMKDGCNLLFVAPAPNDQGTFPLQANNFHAILA